MRTVIYASGFLLVWLIAVAVVFWPVTVLLGGFLVARWLATWVPFLWWLRPSNWNKKGTR